MSETPPPVSFVYFDLDDTLLDHRRAERAALAEVCRDHAAHLGHLPLETVQETYHTHNAPLWRDYAAGCIDKDSLKRLRFERTLAALGIAGLDPAAVNTHYLACYRRHWHLVEAARVAYLRVAERFPVGLLTNGFREEQHAKLKRFPELHAHAATVIISEEVGVMKPHPALFAHAAEAAATPPEKILYIGDSLTSDVEGARGAGWHAAWYTPHDEAADAPEGVFRFRRWNTLTRWLLEDRG